MTMTQDERVHPSEQPQTPQYDEKPLLAPQGIGKGTYVIQIPKDQIFRNPPPENSQKFANRKPRRSSCCRCFCFTILIFLLLLAVATAVLYLVFRPQKLIYSIEKLSITGVNLTSSSSSSPLNIRMNLNITSQNPNDKISVFYVKGSQVNVYYDDVKLCNGVLPVFEHKPNNVTTLIQTVLRGNGVVLARDVHARLVKQDKGRNVPLKLKLKAPVKLKIGAVKTWEITVTVNCDVAVDRLTTKSKIVSNTCGYRVKLW